MKTYPVKRVTIIGANSLQETLLEEIHQLGSSGYTYAEVNGDGAKGVRPSAWRGPNVKIEVIASKENAEKILEHVARNYFESYAVIAYMDEVQVLRPDKFR